MNIILLKKTPELEHLCQKLGFAQTLFLDDLALITGSNKKEIVKMINQAKKKKLFTIYSAADEKTLRFVLEKTAIDLVYNLEMIHHHDHTHYPRGGLDQINCKIAAEKKKIIGISFSQLLNAKNKAQLLSRIIFNLHLCQKYKVKTLLSNFSINKDDLRSKKDLDALLSVFKKYHTKL